MTKLEKDFFNSLDKDGVITLGSRLKRISDLCFTQSQELYDLNNRSFKASWFAVLVTIKKEGQILFKEIAEKIFVTPPAVSQVMKELVDHELVEIETGKDRRSRVVKLSKKGEAALEKIIPDLVFIEKVLEEFLGSDASKLISKLSTLEEKLRESSFAQKSEEKKRSKC